MKIGIVGSGLVGATSAYAMVMRGIGREIVMIDKDEDRAKAEASDIMHAVPFAEPLTVRQGPYEQLDGSRIVVLSAGVSQKPGESRLDLLKRNAAVFEEVVPMILRNAPEAVLVVATNPVDVMTQMAASYAAREGVARSKVIGTGTTLDTARLRSLLGRHCGVDPHHVHAYVLGEHGDSEVLTWSLTTVAGMPVAEFCRIRQIELNADVKQSIDYKVRNAAYTIINGKGATYYGIGSAVARIVRAVLYDQQTVLTVSTPTEDVLGVRDVSISLPRLIGGQGIAGTFPLPLNEQETSALRESARIVRSAVDDLNDS